MDLLDRLFQEDPTRLQPDEKAALLAGGLSELSQLHWDNCVPYQRILRANGFVPPFAFDSVADAPALPVSLFKQFELRSVPQANVMRVLRSSGTTQQVPSRIFLDAETARLQARALVRIFQPIIGTQRIPMLIVDQNAVVGDGRSFSARGAGVLGLSNFGRNHTYVLDAAMKLDLNALDAFIEKADGQRVFVFGFTFMVWKYFVQPLIQAKRRLPFDGGVLVHSGGWKKMQDEAVDRAVFRERVGDVTGIRAVHDFYGMVEQVGSVFVECSEGYLHAPVFADVLIRDPRTWRVVNSGETGVIQVLSVLPRSYPGHSLLTEDLGQRGPDECACGHRGRSFRVLGRVPKAEVRGCSDTHVVQA
jgi:phenylacetate-coenzyme A ligase PaaK-like adenylate-forming protein